MMPLSTLQGSWLANITRRLNFQTLSDHRHLCKDTTIYEINHSHSTYSPANSNTSISQTSLLTIPCNAASCQQKDKQGHYWSYSPGQTPVNRKLIGSESKPPSFVKKKKKTENKKLWCMSYYSGTFLPGKAVQSDSGTNVPLRTMRSWTYCPADLFSRGTFYPLTPVFLLRLCHPRLECRPCQHLFH